jgi:phage integrase domain protein SAM domain protein
MIKIEQQIAKYLDWCQNVCRLKPVTMDYIKSNLNYFKRTVDAKDARYITNYQINQWIGTYGRCFMGSYTPVSDRTLNKRIGVIVGFFKFLKDCGYKLELQTPYIRKVKAKRQKRIYYTREEIKHVLKYAQPLEMLCIKMKFDSGLRLMELANIRLNHIDGRQIKVIGKGNKEEFVYITIETYFLLQKYIQVTKLSNDDWLFPCQRGDNKFEQHVSKATITRWLRNPFLKAAENTNNFNLREKLYKFHPHTLRHSFATDLQRNGTPINIIKELMRHDHNRTTEEYLHLFDQFKIDYYDKYRLPINATIDDLVGESKVRQVHDLYF